MQSAYEPDSVQDNRFYFKDGDESRVKEVQSLSGNSPTTHVANPTCSSLTDFRGAACNCYDRNSFEDKCLPVCGDGLEGLGEACDDGNTDNGDGCSNDCTTIEDGYECTTGDPSVCSMES